MKNAEHPPETASSLQRQIAERILKIIADKNLGVGTPLRESVLAKDFSVSRTPVRAALDFLCELGAVEYVPRRGFFLSVAAADLPKVSPAPSPQSTGRVHSDIIDAYFDGRLTARISEAELMRRFNVDRLSLLESLNKLAAEGIAQQSPGYGWQFAPRLKSRQADAEDLFRFRLLLEPAVFLEPEYKADHAQLDALRAEQRKLLDQVHAELDLTQLYAANNRLHDTLTAFSGNRFLISALRFEDPAAKLNEYHHYQDHDRIRAALEEHIAILDAVQSGALKRASQLMRQHITMAQLSDSC